jgi:hypothetical protein
MYIRQTRAGPGSPLLLLLSLPRQSLDSGAVLRACYATRIYPPSDGFFNLKPYPQRIRRKAVLVLNTLHLCGPLYLFVYPCHNPS